MSGRDAVENTRFVDALGQLRAAGWALCMVMPADDPAVALLRRDGVTLRVERDDVGLGALSAPGFEATRGFELTRPAETGWGTGRAGMEYRDLLPSRRGGQVIASHIRIPEAGPVADDVHYHLISFQLIYCIAGWVRLVYEGQGDEFVLAAGDCVLQPPEIRHRVLEASAGLEVLEVSAPAVHETWFDHELALPTPVQERTWAGQRFVHHRAASASWTRRWADGFEARDTGLADASGGLVDVRIVRAAAGAAAEGLVHEADLRLWFVLAGGATVRGDELPVEPLEPGTAVAVPAGTVHAIEVGSHGLELVEVTVPRSSDAANLQSSSSSRASDFGATLR